LHAGLLWACVSATVILTMWLVFQWVGQPGPQSSASPPVAAVAASQQPVAGASQPADLPDAPVVDANTQATVLGVSASPAPPPALPPPGALADTAVSQLPARVLLEVPRNRQDRNLNCELRSATDLAMYYGWDFTWERLFETVGIDPAGDPNVGFVGRSMNDPVGGIYPAGYGVYAEPVARGLRRLGVPATAHIGKDREWLKSQLDAGRPVVVWTTYGMQPQEVVEWQTARGDTVRGVRFEHTFVVAGYDENGVWVNDPWDATQRHYPWTTLEASWALLGQMALTIDEQTQP
jgi:uncharacterized protein YvpB